MFQSRIAAKQVLEKLLQKVNDSKGTTGRRHNDDDDDDMIVKDDSDEDGDGEVIDSQAVEAISGLVIKVEECLKNAPSNLAPQVSGYD